MTELVVGAVINIAIGLLLNALFSPKQRIEGPKLQDLSVSGSSFGQPWSIPFGTTRQSTNMIWKQDIVQIKVEKEVGGKGGVFGGGDATQTVYEPFCDFAVGVCRGPVSRILQIYGNRKLIYDATGQGKVTDIYEGVEKAALQQLTLSNSFNSTLKGLPGELAGTEASTSTQGQQYPTAQTGLPMRFYYGDEIQLPDPLIESFEGTGNASAHRGLCYLVFEKLPLRNFNYAVPDIQVVVARDADDTILRQQLSAFATFNIGGVEVDFRRRKLVFAGQDAFSGANYDTMIQNVSNPNVVTGSVAGSNISIGRDGAVYYLNGPGNDMPLRKLHPTSFEQIAISNTFPRSPFNDVQAIRSTVMKQAGTDVHFIAVSPNQGGVSFFLDRSDGTLFDVTPAGFDNLVSGNDLSQASGVGGLFFWDELREILYHIQHWTAGSDDPTAPYVLWKYTFSAIPFPGNTLSAVVRAELLKKFPRNDAVNGLAGNGFVTGFFVPQDNSLILHSGDTIKYDLETGAIVARNSVLPDFGAAMKKSNIVGGVFAFANGGPIGGNFYEVSLADLSLLRTTPVSSVQSSGTIINNIFDGETYSILSTMTSPTTISRYYLNRAVGNLQSLSSIVQEICLEAGLETTDIDVTNLNGIMVRGAIANQQTTARSIIEALMQAFFFDFIETDDVLRAVVRGQAVARTLEYDKLGELRDEEGLPDPTSGRVVEERVQEIEVPRRVSLKYMDQNRAYQIGAQHSQRVTNPGPTMFSSEEFTMELPIVLTATEAKQITEIWLYNLWSGRSVIKTVMDWENIDLDVSDVVDLPLPSGTRTARISKMDIGANLAVDVEFQEEDRTAFDAVSSANAGFGFQDQSIPNSPLTKVFFMDVPLLNAADASGGQVSRGYFGMAGFAPGWPGGLLMRSQDGGVDYAQVGFTNDDVAWGVANAAIPAPPRFACHQWDTTTTITFYPEAGSAQFTSKTDLQVLNGANAVLVGSEIIQFATAVLNANGSITLSRLLRGRLGTERNIAFHVAGENVVLLQIGSVRFHNLALALVGDPLLYKAVTLSHRQETADVELFTYTGSDLKPYAVAHLRGVRAGSNLTITWRRRTRYNRVGLVGTTPINEVAEEYLVELRQKGVLLRSATVTAPTLVYSVANYTTDTGLAAGQYLLENADFENGLQQGDITGWVTSGTPAGRFDVVASSGALVAPQSGSFFCVCDESIFASQSLIQTRHLINDWHFTLEDIFQQPAFTISCYTGKPSDSDDTLEFKAEWLSEADAVVATHTTGAIAQPAGAAWVARTLTGNVPIGARKLRISFIVIAITGLDNNPNGAIDDVRVFIGAGVPKVQATVYQVSEAIGNGFAKVGVV